MLKRTITGAVLIALLVPVLYFSDTWVFPAVIALLSAAAIYEFASCVGEKRKAVYLPIMLISLLSPVLTRFLGGEQIIFVLLMLEFLFILCATVLYHDSAVGIAELCSGIFYITGGFSLLVWVRDAFPDTYMLFIIIPISTDTFAYFTGSLVGKHKLCPDLSPKKTVEGAVGGVVGALLGTVIYGIITISIGGYFNFAAWCVSSVSLSVLSMFGDLFASAVKRRHGVKDYGSIFPGHGGVMDRLDSIPPLTIAAYIAITVTKLILR